MSSIQPLWDPDLVAWVHFGDLHITDTSGENYQDFLELIEHANVCSTGQIDKGPPGFSIITLDHNIVSWKFKELDTWPFVMITSPADKNLITDSSKADEDNAIGAYPNKGILGTRLGPNKNGTKGPWPSWRDRRWRQ